MRRTTAKIHNFSVSEGDIRVRRTLYKTLKAHLQFKQAPRFRVGREAFNSDVRVV
jgi:hypothetical protein